MTELEQYIEFVASDNALTPEEKQSLTALLSKDKVKDRVKDSYLMRQDYSRKTQEVAADRKKVEETQQRLLAWEKEARAKVDKLNSDLESRDMTLAQYQARMKRVADEYGIEIKDLPGLDGAAATTGAGTAAAAGTKTDGPDYGARIQKFEEQLSSAGRVFPDVAAELYELGIDHQELFGKPLRGARELVKKAMEQGVTLRAAWEQEHKVPERRNENLREQIRTEERGKLESEFRQRSSELALGGDQKAAPAPLSPVLSRQFKPMGDGAAANSGTSNAGSNNAPPPEPGGRSAAERELDGGAAHAAQKFMQRRMQGVAMGAPDPAVKG